MKAKKNSHKTKNAGGTLIGMFIGLVLGVVMCSAVVLYLNKTPLPFNLNAQNNKAPQRTQPLKMSNPTGDNRFSFYDILPGKTEAQGGNAKVAGLQAIAPKINQYFVQTGSFARANEADNQKAQLALMGLEANIQQLIVKDQNFYRVRLGPFTEKEAKATHNELLNAGIAAQVVQ